MNYQVLRLLPIVFVLSLFVSVYADSIPVANYSFEDPNGPFGTPPALPYATDWIELDMDPLGYSQNTGVFLNVTGIADANGVQLAFLGSQEGNAFLQDLNATYQVGKSYKLTVGVCVSAQCRPVSKPTRTVVRALSSSRRTTRRSSRRLSMTRRVIVRRGSRASVLWDGEE